MEGTNSRLQRICYSLAFVALCGSFAGCENSQFGAREKGALTGGALGAGLGAIIGNQTGSTGAGIAIGSAIGALGGAAVGNSIDTTDRSIDERDERISAQERELRENARLLSELKATGLDVRETSRGVVVNLPDVLFEFDSAHLAPAARGKIADIADAVRRSGDRRVSVEGHTDSVGTYQYNQRLSEDRAHAVADELVQSGIQRRRLTSRGFGESEPVSSNSTERGRAQNRRVEVVIDR